MNMNKAYEQVAAGNLSGQTYAGQTVGQITASNGHIVTVNPDNGRLWDAAGAYGYSTHFTGAYVCYSCGHLCECNELYGDPDNTCISCGVIDPSGIEILHLTTCTLV